VARARILLADDHQEMRDRVVRLLGNEFEIVGAFGDGQALVEAARKLKPDVCLIDISMPGLNGIEAAIEIKTNGSSSKVIFLTVHEDPDFVQAALKTGALGYVIKRRLASDLRVAINQVLAGNAFISSSILIRDSSTKDRG
jgi:DNA-binding NarL/FixJ family response regulator